MVWNSLRRWSWQRRLTSLHHLMQNRIFKSSTKSDQSHQQLPWAAGRNFNKDRRGLLQGKVLRSHWRTSKNTTRNSWKKRKRKNLRWPSTSSRLCSVIEKRRLIRESSSIKDWNNLSIMLRDKIRSTSKVWSNIDNKFLAYTCFPNRSWRKLTSSCLRLEVIKVLRCRPINRSPR